MRRKLTFLLPLVFYLAGLPAVLAVSLQKFDPGQMQPRYNPLTNPDPFHWPEEPPRVLDPNPLRLHPDPTRPEQFVGEPPDPTRPADLFRPGPLGIKVPDANTSPFQSNLPVAQAQQAQWRERLWPPAALRAQQGLRPAHLTLPTKLSAGDQRERSQGGGEGGELLPDVPCPLKRVAAMRLSTFGQKDAAVVTAAQHGHSIFAQTHTAHKALQRVLVHVASSTGLKNMQTGPAIGNTVPNADGLLATGDLDDPSKLPQVRIHKHFFSCWDGRAAHAVMGAPGGDAAELVLALHALEQGRPVSQLPSEAQTRDLLLALLAAREKVYLHTDAVAYARWKRAAEAEPLHPTSYEEREKVIRLYTVPEHVGCDHLRALLTDASYGVRFGLVRAVLRGLLRVYLDGGNPLRKIIVFDVLKGYPHQEVGILNVLTPSAQEESSFSGPLVMGGLEGEEGCGGHTALVQPSLQTQAKEQYLVLHPRALLHARTRTAKLLAELEKLGPAPGSPIGAAAALLSTISKEGRRHLRLAREAKAAASAARWDGTAGLPSFLVQFTPDLDPTPFPRQSVVQFPEASPGPQLPPMPGGVRQNLGPDWYKVPVNAYAPDQPTVPLPRPGPAPRWVSGGGNFSNPVQGLPGLPGSPFFDPSAALYSAQPPPLPAQPLPRRNGMVPDQIVPPGFSKELMPPPAMPSLADAPAKALMPKDVFLSTKRV